MKLERHHIMALKTPKGGFSRAITGLPGVAWPLRKGWVGRTIGLDISQEDYQKVKFMCNLPTRDLRILERNQRRAEMSLPIMSHPVDNFVDNPWEDTWEDQKRVEILRNES